MNFIFQSGSKEEMLVSWTYIYIQAKTCWLEPLLRGSVLTVRVTSTDAQSARSNNRPLQPIDGKLNQLPSLVNNWDIL